MAVAERSSSQGKMPGQDEAKPAGPSTRPMGGRDVLHGQSRGKIVPGAKSAFNPDVVIPGKPLPGEGMTG